jgi:hypothetical protein
MAVPHPISLTRPARLLAPLLGACSAVMIQTPLQAGLLRPLLNLMQPQLEQRLSRACVAQLGGDDAGLAARLEQPCRTIAQPTSRCLIDETDRSGRGLGVLSEMLAGRFGDASEVVVKRCLARQLGLPADSLQELPLRELVQRYVGRTRP